MDNQQATQTELAWLAGMLEGDGYINIAFNRVGRKLKRAYALTAIEFMNTDKAIIENVVSIAKKVGINLYVKQAEQKSHLARRKILYRASTHRMKSAKPLLEAMRPYLVGEKSQRADYMLAFINSRQKTLAGNRHSGWNNLVKYTPEEIELVVKCKHLVAPWKSSETIRAELVASQL